MAKPLPPAALAPSDPQIVDHGLEADFFFEENKGKIAVVLLIAILALAGWIAYHFHQVKARREEAELFYSAKSTGDWQAVIAKYPGSVVAGNAQLLLGASLRDANKLDEALAVLADFTSKNGTHPLIAQGWLSYAGTLEAKGDLVNAAKTYAKIGSQFGTTEAAPPALASEARLVKKAGDGRKAREIYENIVQRFPTSIWSDEAQRELGKLPE